MTNLKEIDISKLASRAGKKLLFALQKFDIDLSEKVCADLGCSTGGFTDVMLKAGAAKVYSVDTGKNVLKYRLREDSRVVVMEQTNALHVDLPEKVDFISIDVGWTPQRLIIPHALELLKDDGVIISLLKTHYEARKEWLEKAKARVKKEFLESVIEKVKEELLRIDAEIVDIIESPIKGGKGKNVEYLMLLRKK